MSDQETGSTERLAPFLGKWGIRIGPDAVSRLNIFLDELDVWNRKINLTGLKSRRRIIEELLADSILPVPFLPDEGDYLDVGSGAGFPAIPIKILKPLLNTRLVEPKAKKVHFLRQVIRLSRLHGIEVIQGRIEEQGEAFLSRGYDVITSRALLPLAGLLSILVPRLSPEGCLVAFLGGQGLSSGREGLGLMERHGLVLFKRLTYRVPGTGGEREILVLKKAK